MMSTGAPWGPGKVIADRYRLEELFGQGGMGSVWRAEHLTLRSSVAIKLLDPAILGSPEILDRFMREAQSAAALRSMHVVQIFDYGVDQGVPYIAMELLQGESLADRLKRVGRLPFAQTARVMQHIARAISKAHSAGIVHRDLKPENVFLVMEEEEIAKVLDFGIAKVTDPLGPGDGSGSGSGTRTGALLGTPYYMSPEQARGTKTVDHRTDLWAMAVIAYECLVGSKPFVSDAIGDLVVKICTQEAPVPSRFAQLPAGFDSWFAKGIARDPDERFQSAEQLSDALVVALGVSGAPLSGAVGDQHTMLAASDTGNSLGSGVAATAAVMGASGSLAAAEMRVGAGSWQGRRWAWPVALAGLLAVGGLAIAFILGRSNITDDELAEQEASAEPSAEVAPATAQRGDELAEAEALDNRAAAEAPTIQPTHEQPSRPTAADPVEPEAVKEPRATPPPKPGPPAPSKATATVRSRPAVRKSTQPVKPSIRKSSSTGVTRTKVPASADLFSDRK